ncbi:MAG: biopolymer transporter ExbD, partial [Planctomycetota bacterium]
MRRARPIDDILELQIMPLVDVIFLLLTFFVFALALMVRADVLGVTLAPVAAGERAAAPASLTVALAQDVGYLLDGQPATLEQAVERARALRDSDAAAAIYIASDADAPAGALLQLLDALSQAGIDDFSLLG